MPVLLKNATADGPGSVVRWSGGPGTFWVDGTPAPPSPSRPTSPFRARRAGGRPEIRASPSTARPP